MGRFAKELPHWTKEYMTKQTIDLSFSTQLRTEMTKVGDHYLAQIYAELPTYARASILADAIETEMIDRFIAEHLMVPPLVIEDESVAVGSI